MPREEVERKVEIEIEYHTHDVASQPTIKKEQYASKVLELERSLDDAGLKDAVRIVQNPGPGRDFVRVPYQDGMFVRRGNHSGPKKIYPRHGAFEVTLRSRGSTGVDNVKLWSKLESKLWPKFEKVAADVAALLHAAANDQATEISDVVSGIEARLKRSASAPSAGRPPGGGRPQSVGSSTRGASKPDPRHLSGSMTPKKAAGLRNADGGHGPMKGDLPERQLEPSDKASGRRLGHPMAPDEPRPSPPSRPPPSEERTVSIPPSEEMTVMEVPPSSSGAQSSQTSGGVTDKKNEEERKNQEEAEEKEREAERLQKEAAQKKQEASRDSARKRDRDDDPESMCVETHSAEVKHPDSEDRAGENDKEKALQKDSQEEALESLPRKGRTTPRSSILDTAMRGITLPQLRELEKEVSQYFTEHSDCWDKKAERYITPENANMHNICTHIVKPKTKAAQCSYVEWIAEQAQPPRWMVSHAWTTPFTSTMCMLALHSKNRREECDPSQMAYWICTLANNQHKMDEELGGDELLKTPFAAVLTSEECRGTVVLCDDEVTPLQRVWCIFEAKITSDLRDGRLGTKMEHRLDLMCLAEEATTNGDSQAASGKRSATMLKDVDGGDFDEVCEQENQHFPFKVAEKGVYVKIQNAKASQAADRNAILSYIVTKGKKADKDFEPPAIDVEYEVLNNFVHMIFASAELYRIAVQKPASWKRDMAKLIHMGADPNKCIRDGNTALHAVVGGDPASVTREDSVIREIIVFLVDRGANPNILNPQNQKTVLDQTIETASEPVRSVLTERGAKHRNDLDEVVRIQMNGWSLRNEGIATLADTFLGDDGATSIRPVTKRIVEEVKNRLPFKLKALQNDPGVTSRASEEDQALVEKQSVNLSLAKNGITAAGANKLVEAMDRSKLRFNSLVLDANPLDAKSVANPELNNDDGPVSWRTCLDLKVLSLRGCKLRDQIASGLALLLETPNCKLTDLTLADNEIGNPASTRIFKALAAEECPLLRLDMSNNRFGDDAVLALTDAMNQRSRRKTEKPTCKVILNNNSITDDSAVSLYKAMCSVHFHDQEYDSTNTPAGSWACVLEDTKHVGDKFIASFAEHLTGNPASKLMLQGNQVTDAGVEKLSQAWAEGRLSTLQTLDLAYNRNPVRMASKGPHQDHYLSLGPVAVKHIADAIKKGCSLEILRLDGNAILDEGAAALALALQDPVCELKQLSLQKSMIGDEGAFSLAEALECENCCLQELWLADNPITGTGAASFRRAEQRPCSRMYCLDLPVSVEDVDGELQERDRKLQEREKALQEEQKQFEEKRQREDRELQERQDRERELQKKEKALQEEQRRLEEQQRQREAEQKRRQARERELQVREKALQEQRLAVEKQCQEVRKKCEEGLKRVEADLERLQADGKAVECLFSLRARRQDQEEKREKCEAGAKEKLNRIDQQLNRIEEERWQMYEEWRLEAEKRCRAEQKQREEAEQKRRQEEQRRLEEQQRQREAMARRCVEEM